MSAILSIVYCTKTVCSFFSTSVCAALCITAVCLLIALIKTIIHVGLAIVRSWVRLQVGSLSGDTWTGDGFANR